MKNILLLLSGLLIGASAQAFSVSPDLVQLNPSGPRASSVIQVQNEGNSEVSIATYLKTRSYDKNGKEHRGKVNAAKTFLVLPSNFKVKPHKSVSVRIVYIGNKKIDKEHSYRLIFANLTPRPLKKIKEKGVTENISALVSYAISLYVTPEKAESHLVVSKEKSKKAVDFLIKNTGKKRALPKYATVTISDGKSKSAEKYSGHIFKEFASPIMAGESRLIKLPKESKVDPQKAKLEIKNWQ